MTNRIANLMFIFVFILSFASRTDAYNVELNAESFLTHFASNIPSLMRMVTAISYVLGMSMMIKSIVQLKHLGESRTMMSRDQGLKGPLIFMAVGSLLLFLPTSIQVGLSTFWSIPCSYCYLTQAGQWHDILNTCYLIIQFIGVIAFIRGLLLISQLGNESHQAGIFARGMTHIVGGILCINIFQFVQVIQSTFGIHIS